MFRVKNLTLEQEKQIIYYYQDKKMGQIAVSKKVLGISNPNIVKNILKKYNIHIRTQQEAAILSNKNRASHKKEDYFSTQNSNMAWLLGFLAADGSIRKNENEIKIGLSIKDKEILEKIKRELELETSIKEYTNSQGYDCCKLQWTCEQHKKDLAKYNIVPEKTFVLKPPYELNQNFWIDYIRGYFDGDGSINLISNSNGRGNGNLRWQVCSATKEILEFILQVFEEQYNIPKVNIYERQGLHTLYYIQYSSTATRKIYSILYTPNSLFLERKKKHFEDILQIVSPLK